MIWRRLRRHPLVLLVSALLLLVVGLWGAVELFAGPWGLEPRTAWLPAIGRFFAFLEAPVWEGSEEERFWALFSPAGREDFLARFGGREGLVRAAARHHAEEFPWPGRYHGFRFLYGLLGPVQLDRAARTALAPTMVDRSEEGIEVARARIYRFALAPGPEGGGWVIDRVEFVRDDPTVANAHPLYITTLVVGLAALALNLPALLFAGILFWREGRASAHGWLSIAYGRLFRGYTRGLEAILSLGRGLLGEKLPLTIVLFVVFPGAFYGLLRLLAWAVPGFLNSHLGFLVVLLLVGFFLGLAAVRETRERFEARSGAAYSLALGRALERGGYLPVKRFDAESFRSVSVGMVLLVVVFLVAGILPYLGRFRVGLFSSREMVFEVERRVEATEAGDLFRLPSFEERFVIGRVEPGETLPMLERVRAEAGDFYRVALGRRSLAYLPAARAEERPRRVEFGMEGDFINYLDELGRVGEVGAPAGEPDPEGRILAEAFREEAHRWLRQGTLEGYTRAVHELDRALSFAPAWGEPFLERAYAIASIARLLREDAAYNAFGLAGDRVPNPGKTAALLLRAKQNLAAARERGVGGAAPPVEALIALFGGRAREARRLAAAEVAAMGVGEGEVVEEVGVDRPGRFALQAALMTTPDRRRAAELVEELLRVEPDNAELLGYRGLLQLHDDPAAAASTLGRAERIAPDSADARIHLAATRWGSAPRETAAALEELVAEHPNFPNKARFQLALHRGHRVILLLVPLLLAAWGRGVTALVRRRPVRRYWIWAGVLRVLMLLAVLLAIAWLAVPATLPRYGVIDPPLPPIGASLYW